MKYRLVITKNARIDLIESHKYLNKVRHGLGLQFDKRVDEAFQRIAVSPEMYAIINDDVRAVSIKQFRHVIYYVMFADRVEIIAVLHGSRDSSLWQERLP